MDPLIKCENLGVAYDLGKTNEVWALRDINIEIYPNEYIVFFGPSGCGKSTLLYTIAGLEAPTKGKVFVGGRDLSRLSQKELVDFHLFHIGMVFQAYYLIPELSVRNNILLPQILGGVSSFERDKKTDSLMKRFEIENLQNRKSSTLSGGQQQRVAIARALVNDPLVILADEPMGNLDSKNAEIVNRLLSELNEKDGKTIIHVTHDSRYLNQANRIFYMKDGGIVRTVVNTEKRGPKIFSAEDVSELQKLAQIYPYFEESRLKAKLILNHLFFPFDIDVQQKIEKLVEDYLSKRIDENFLFRSLDRSPINLYLQTAKNLSEKIVNLAKGMDKIEKEKYREEEPILEERAVELRAHLLDSYSGKITFEQIMKLGEILSLRMIGKISADSLKEFFDKPLNKGGVGLNKRTASRFARETNLILIKK